MQQQQATKNLIQQDVSQIDTVSTNLINDCTTTQSISELTSCKASMSDLQNRCKDPAYSSMKACSDPRIGQFFSTVDSKISFGRTQLVSDATNLNNQILKMIDVCSQATDTATISTCKTEMTQIQQQDCGVLSSSFDSVLGANSIPACRDPRIPQIINEQIAYPSNEYNAANQNTTSQMQSANQYTSSYLDSCMQARDSTTIQTCSLTAKKMLDYCNNISSVGIGQICNDPRLQQIANMGQAANSPAPLTASPAAANGTTFESTNAAIELALNECSNSAISNSPVCIQGMNSLKQECQGPLKPYLSYVPACNDPRLQ